MICQIWVLKRTVSMIYILELMVKKYCFFTLKIEFILMDNGSGSRPRTFRPMTFRPNHFGQNKIATDFYIHSDLSSLQDNLRTCCASSDESQPFTTLQD